MKFFFNIKIEFDKTKVDQVIEATIKGGGKGYVCSVESNNLTVANKNLHFQNVINNALINICDGSMLAAFIGFIHRKPYKPYIGDDLFISYIKKRCYKQFFLGNTREVLDRLKENLKLIDPEISKMPFETLPFKRVEEFDYKGIAEMINEKEPDIIWVSLGAPKQEEFMWRLLPYLKKGVMFGFGAIFNFNAGKGHGRRAPGWIRRLKFEWLYRAFEEPRKNIPRYWNFIKILPKLIILEHRKVNQAKSQFVKSKV